jgi:hypothetical protein
VTWLVHIVNIHSNLPPCLTMTIVVPKMKHAVSVNLSVSMKYFKLVRLLTANGFIASKDANQDMTLSSFILFHTTILQIGMQHSISFLVKIYHVLDELPKDMLVK